MQVGLPSVNGGEGCIGESKSCSWIKSTRLSTGEREGLGVRGRGDDRPWGGSLCSLKIDAVQTTVSYVNYGWLDEWMDSVLEYCS